MDREELVRRIRECVRPAAATEAAAARAADRVLALLEDAGLLQGTISGLTVRQGELLRFLQEEADRGRCPSYEQMRTVLGLASKSGVNRLLTGLRARGAVAWNPSMPRSVRVLRRLPAAVPADV